MRVVFMGSPDFAVPSLTSLIEAFEVTGVVTQPNRPAGRGRRLQSPEVKQIALQAAVPVIQPTSLKHPEVLRQIEAWRPDVIVVAAFGQLVPEPILKLTPSGCVNVHPSLLPRWRGASPIQAAILHGDPETGVTLMKLDAGLDTGPILAQQRLTLDHTVTGGELGRQLSAVGAALLVETLPEYVSGKIVPTAQDETQATYAPAIPKSAGLLDFGRTAAELGRRVRAYEPRPGSYLVWHGRRLIVRRARSRAGAGGVTGEVILVDGDPAVVTADGLLVLEVVQPEGKGPMDGRSFVRGAAGFAGSILSSPPAA